MHSENHGCDFHMRILRKQDDDKLTIHGSCGRRSSIRFGDIRSRITTRSEGGGCQRSAKARCFAGTIITIQGRSINVSSILIVKETMRFAARRITLVSIHNVITISVLKIL